ncbi:MULTISPECIES: MurR/RpiR family transcriptional regulator [Anaerotruncus]|uniref:MurR/RpiR family transcriptional regulator n=2 Tax=Oscillospiraceae TaxID=216572 RepID=UPI00082C28D6|nr:MULTISPECIES: MurR/RpiR family transcriptional regulator [Anaerotruncus]RGX54604.1 MurR/RpiR family transcriptional regulator [Anaerotruncus sp. AF02-27]
MPDFSGKVSGKFDTLTHSQKAVAHYAMEHMDMIAFNTLDDIATKIGVSTTTIIRFARELGYSGYSDMQKDVQSSIMDKVSLPERFTSKRDSINRDKLLMDTVQNDIADITNTLSNISQDSLRQAIDMIASARNIYVLGMRSSFALAHYMTSRLGQIRPGVKLIQSIGMIFPEEMVGAGSEDICIAYLFPRYSKTAANLILWLKNMGVRVILFTSQNYAAVQSYGDVFLPCSVGGVSFKNSFVAPMSLTNYLAAAVALQDYSGALETLRQTEEFLNKGYYLGL